MIRVIIRQVNEASAVHIGGPVEIRYHTFDIEAPAVEAFLIEPARMNDHYTSREVVGCELRPAVAEKRETP